jgi:hypothetical protein
LLSASKSKQQVLLRRIWQTTIYSLSAPAPSSSVRSSSWSFSGMARGMEAKLRTYTPTDFGSMSSFSVYESWHLLDECFHGTADVILMHFLYLCQCLKSLANLQSSATSVTGFGTELGKIHICKMEQDSLILQSSDSVTMFTLLDSKYPTMVKSHMSVRHAQETPRSRSTKQTLLARVGSIIPRCLTYFDSCLSCNGTLYLVDRPAAPYASLKTSARHSWPMGKHGKGTSAIARPQT